VDKTAILIKIVPVNLAGAIEKVWKMIPPVKYANFEEVDGKDILTFHEARYIVTSAVIVKGSGLLSGPQTYAFVSDADGRVLFWADLPGSIRGILDHERVIRDMGYEIDS
jgi:hypothetical protein